MMRAVMLACLFLLSPALAFADASVAGQWEADLGDNVKIAMDVLADGHWHSQTVKDNTVVATMSGTYRQSKKTPKSGSLVFTPVNSKVSAQHGAPKVEHDSYTLSDDRQVLRLTTGGDTMQFTKQSTQ
jgi:hypothetical protein